MTLKIGALTKLGLFFPVLCFIHVFDQTSAEQLYRDKGLLRAQRIIGFLSILISHQQMSILANPVAPLGDKQHLTPKTPLSDTEFRITFARHCSFGHIFIIKMDRALIDCACTAALEARGFLAHERT